MIKSDFGRLDIAFANAGTERGDANVEAVTLEAWNDIVGINQTGVLLTIKSAIALMKQNPEGPGGSIIVNVMMPHVRDELSERARWQLCGVSRRGGERLSRSV